MMVFFENLMKKNFISLIIRLKGIKNNIIIKYNSPIACMHSNKIDKQ